MTALPKGKSGSYAILSKTIKTFRKKQGLSQQQLSIKSGVSQGQLSKIERGEHMPSIDNLDAISTALKIPTSLITYLAFDREKEQDKFSKKMFETFDVLLNFWLYIKNIETKDKDNSVSTAILDEKQIENRDELIAITKELKELKNQGIKAISADFIEEYLSISPN